MKVRCDYCGKEFEKSKGNAERYEHNFCCRDHYWKWKSEKKKVKGIESLKNLSDAEKGYIAGYLDADGCIAIGESRGHYSTGVKFDTAARASVKWMKETLQVPTDLRVIYKKDTTKPQHRLEIYNKRYLRVLLSKIKPYLKIKKEQAELALSMINTILNRNTYKYSKELREKLESYKQKMIQLHR